MRQTSIDKLTILYWITGFILSAAVVWLGFVSFEVIQRALYIFFGGLLLVLIMGSMGRIRYEPNGSMDATAVYATSIGLILLMGDAYLLQRWTGMSFFFPTVILVSALFAIYEETGMLGIRAAAKGIDMPDWAVLLFEGVLFVPLHAFSYSLTITIVLVFLIIGRIIMSAAGLMTDKASVPYNIHVIWNVVNAGLLTAIYTFLFGGII